jgi:putative ATPase
MRQFGYGQGYRNAHDEASHFARGASYLPEELGQPQYYVPGSLGFEAAAAERLRRLRALPSEQQQPDED